VNLDELRPILAAYRKQVEPAWSAATAHPDYEGKPGDPTGQCGVTSAWLQRRLWEDHGIATTYCHGSAWCLGNRTLDDHCWLEIGEGMDRLVVDLTAEQVPGLRHWISAPFGQLCDYQIAYVAASRHTAEQPLPAAVQDRLALLTEAVQS
jgi:hypothetical protein